MRSALLGIAFAVLFEIDPMIGVFAVAGLVAVLLLLLQRRGTLSTDALLATPGLRLTEPEVLSWPRLDDPGAAFAASPKPKRRNS